LSEWNPATEAEATMREALAAADQELYFRILARSELLLPVSMEALAGRAPMGWGTWTTGNRTHVLAFTSPAALAACLNEPGGSYRTVPFSALASDWPNYEWWLAVNPGLPIEAYLPSWFVSQLTRGDVRLPGRTMGARARMAQSDLASALGGRVRATTPPPTVVPADVVDAPPSSRVSGTSVPLRPTHPNRPTTTTARAGQPVEAVEVVETIEAEIIDHPPTAPASRVFAQSRPDPVDNESRFGRAPGPGVTFSGRTSSPSSFTAESTGAGSPSRFAGAFTPSRPQEAYVTDGADTVRTTAPRTAANQEPQDAEVVSSGGTWPTGFTPANDTEVNLLAAAEENNTDAFLSTLLLARVILPVPDNTLPGARPTDANFPWQIDEVDGQRFISVYTSPERLKDHSPRRLGPGPNSVSLRFVQLIAAWPDEAVSFAINPGSPVGATLPGSQLVALAAWATEVGLRDDPSAEVAVSAKKAETKPTVGVAGAPAVGAARATVMQRTVPPAQLPFYLERGYDRVSGFVNRAGEVAHLTSPRLLYRALGLVYSGSPFAEDDPDVHVVRWVAHRSELYRLPYGGQHEAAMRAMQGWVVERAPFRGNGFAPGDTDVVAEFKVDSVRLPHGAQMWRLSKDGTETLVATFDADLTRWLPAGPMFGGGRGA